MDKESFISQQQLPISIGTKLAHFPHNSGIYFFKNETKNTLYIGKAKNLKKRVLSYFSDNNNLRLKKLLKESADIEYIITNSESEALILEHQFIKTHKPKYNIRLKDNKSYPYIKVSVEEMYPRMTLTREKFNTRSLYFGPFTDAYNARVVMRLIQKNYPLRLSKMSLDGTKNYKPCLNYQMGLCFAPCNQHISINNYKEIVRNVLYILKGSYQPFIKKLTSQMAAKSKKLDFEEAAKIRDKIRAVYRILKKQNVISAQKTHRDAVYIHRESYGIGIQLFFIRSGILVGTDFFFIPPEKDTTDEDILRETFSRIYLSGSYVYPQELLLSSETVSANFIQKYLTEKKNIKIQIFYPQKGERKNILELCKKNAIKNLSFYSPEIINTKQNLLQNTKKFLSLSKVPKVIECIDVSNIQGTSTTAALIRMENNSFVKSEYRTYKITTAANDDCASIKELLHRRIERYKKNEATLPNLLIIDGGKSQLNAACEVFQHYNLTNAVEIIALAKGRSKKKRKESIEHLEYDYVVKEDMEEKIPLKKNDPVSQFLQKIRDETHRFVIKYHRKIRGTQSKKSILTSINGIGEKKRKILLQNFKNIQNIQNASLEELTLCTGINKRDVQNIHFFFQNIHLMVK